MKWIKAYKEWLEARRMQKFYEFFIQELYVDGKAKTIYVVDGVCEDCPGPDWCDCDQGIDCD